MRRGLGLCLTALAVLVICGVRLLPGFNPDTLAQYPASTWITDRGGQPLRLVLGEGDLRCEPVPLERTGQWAAKALVAVEDKRFYRHHGVDPVAIVRAVGQNLISRRVASGASTLTTQVVRLTEPRPRTLSTKLVEAAKAMGMERRLEKDDILEQYLNRAPFGGNLTGIQAASLRYFGRDAADLNLAEAALLVGLPQGPSFLRPDRHPERARERRNLVLWRMEQRGFVDRNTRLAARREPVRLANDPPPFRAPHFANLVLARGLGSGGEPDVRTTLDLDLQLIVEEELIRTAASLRDQGVHGGAAVLIEVGSGAVRALVGSPDYDDLAHQGRINCAYRLRSPGSALKPFAYAMAIDRGLITPSTILKDTPVAYAEYEPGNFDGAFHEAVSARYALDHSLNVPALHVTHRVGLSSFLHGLRRLGLEGIRQPARHYGLSLVLGTGEVRLLNLANAYAALARGGVRRSFRLLESEPDAAGVRVFSSEAAYLVADMLSGTDAAAAWVGHTAASRLPRVALKTGTSNGLRDAWALAYNPEYVVGVWLGNPDGSSSPALVGVEVAAPLVYRVFRRLYPDGDAPWFERPAGVSERMACAATGSRAGPFCFATHGDLYIRGVSRAERCQECSNTTAREGPALAPRAQAKGPRIVSPADGTVYRRLASVAGGEQSLLLQATAAGEVFWFVDDRPFAHRSGGEPVPWPLEKGTHRIVCCAASGASDAVEIAVE